MRTPLIAGNWKLNLGPTAGAAVADYLVEELAGFAPRAEVVIFPPALTLPAVAAALTKACARKSVRVGLGVQEIAAVNSGAVTGANSAAMAREVGCEWALIGHSERRQLFGESDAATSAKVKLALAEGLRPMLCIGETLEERKAGRVRTVTERQLGVALAGLQAADLARLVIAYEPVWAIGTGVTATPEQAQQVHRAIRGWLSRRFSGAVASELRLLYGGSVKPGNASELLSCADIDGALVGGASLRASSFADIVRAAPG